jgi:glutamyl/glutaminyl-tRNA synthetase
MANCRFNPSASGILHLGHAVSILVNEYQAHHTGGKFYVRFDDNSPVCLKHGDRLENVVASQQDDIDWIGVPVDGYSYQSEEQEEVRQVLTQKGWKFFEDPKDGTHQLPLAIRMGNDWLAYPYVPQQTAERVISDYMLGVDLIIRGDEFLTEFSLYRFICDLLNVPAPKFVFLPRLQSRYGDISKTNGGYTLTEYRALGYDPLEVRGWVEQAFLYYPALGWEFTNIRPVPRPVG